MTTKKRTRQIRHRVPQRIRKAKLYPLDHWYPSSLHWSADFRTWKIERKEKEWDTGYHNDITIVIRDCDSQVRIHSFGRNKREAISKINKMIKALEELKQVVDKNYKTRDDVPEGYK